MDLDLTLKVRQAAGTPTSVLDKFPKRAPNWLNRWNSED